MAQSQGQRQANPLTAKPRGETDHQDTPSPTIQLLVSTLAVSRAEKSPWSPLPRSSPEYLQHLHALSAPYSTFSARSRSSFPVGTAGCTHFTCDIRYSCHGIGFFNISLRNHEFWPCISRRIDNRLADGSFDTVSMSAQVTYQSTRVGTPR